MTARDAASLLASLSELQHTPQEPWLHACLNLLYWRLRELDPEGLATIPISLAKLNVIVSNGPFLDSFISMTTPRLSGMSAETQVQLLSALAVFGAELPRAWVAAFQLMMVQQAEAGSMTTAQMEQVRLLLLLLGQYNYVLSSWDDAPASSSITTSAVCNVLRPVACNCMWG
jgi:hypothetical protein